MPEDSPLQPTQVGPPSPDAHRATLLKDGQEISSGWTLLEEGSRNGNFYPSILPLANIEPHGVILRVSEKATDIPLEEIVPCRANQLDHWDYRLLEQ